MDMIRTTEAMATEARPPRRPAPRTAPLWPAVLAAWIGGAALPPPATGLSAPAQAGKTQPQA